MQQISNVLRKRYILALSIIALLILISQFVIQFTIQLESSDSRVINIAGRQRMLSQKITKCAVAIAESKDFTEKVRYLGELNTSIALWERSHDGLLLGDQELGLPGKNSSEVLSLFKDIAPYYSKILDSANGIVAVSGNNGLHINENTEAINEYLKIIKSNEPQFLTGMDKIVFQYDAEAKNKINTIRLIEIFLMICTFVTLALEARYIFRPAEESIDNAIRDIDENRKDAQEIFRISPAALFVLDMKSLDILQANSLAATYLDAMGPGDEKYSFEDLFAQNTDNNNDLIYKIKENQILTNEEAVIATNDSTRPVLISSSYLNYKKDPAVLLCMMDISKQKQAESILKNVASLDELTGLLNRRSGKTVLESSLKHACMEKLPLTICFCDIDGLKSVNDRYGHKEGDKYIVAVASAIKSNLREDDFAFRFGGDEFIFALFDRDEKTARIVNERIAQSLKKASREKEDLYPMSISVGIVTHFPPDNTTTADDLIVKADRLMYDVKKLKYENR